MDAGERLAQGGQELSRLGSRTENEPLIVGQPQRLDVAPGGAGARRFGQVEAQHLLDSSYEFALARKPSEIDHAVAGDFADLDREICRAFASLERAFVLG